MTLRDENNDAAFQCVAFTASQMFQALLSMGPMLSWGKGCTEERWVEAQAESLSSQVRDSILSLNAAGKGY